MDITSKIVNHTPRLILLPPLAGFEYGVRLVPGVNSVSQLYLDALNALEVPNDQLPNGKSGGTRFPGREALKLLETAVEIHSVDGRSFGPQITVYTAEAARSLDGQEGPKAPESLGGYEVEGAQALIRLVTDIDALKRYAKDRRSPVAAAAKARLSELTSA